MDNSNCLMLYTLVKKPIILIIPIQEHLSSTVQRLLLELQFLIKFPKHIIEL